jgi:hypothetical protein
MNYELVRIWKEAVGTRSRYYPGMCLEYPLRIAGVPTEIRIELLRPDQPVR